MILRLSLVENKPALLRTQSKDLLVKSNKATTEETRVPAVYRKMTDKTQQNMADSFSESAFRLSMTRLDSIYTIELVACEM